MCVTHFSGGDRRRSRTAAVPLLPRPTAVRQMPLVPVRKKRLVHQEGNLTVYSERTTLTYTASSGEAMTSQELDDDSPRFRAALERPLPDDTEHQRAFDDFTALVATGGATRDQFVDFMKQHSGRGWSNVSSSSESWKTLSSEDTSIHTGSLSGSVTSHRTDGGEQQAVADAQADIAVDNMAKIHQQNEEAADDVEEIRWNESLDALERESVKSASSQQSSSSFLTVRSTEEVGTTTIKFRLLEFVGGNQEIPVIRAEKVRYTETGVEVLQRSPVAAYPSRSVKYLTNNNKKIIYY